jgi:hypothetical protein
MKFGFTVVEKKVVHFLFLQIFKFYSKIKSNFEFTETLDLSSCEFKSKFQKLFKIWVCHKSKVIEFKIWAAFVFGDFHVSMQNQK